MNHYAFRGTSVVWGGLYRNTELKELYDLYDSHCYRQVLDKATRVLKMNSSRLAVLELMSDSLEQIIEEMSSASSAQDGVEGQAQRLDSYQNFQNRVRSEISKCRGFGAQFFYLKKQA